MASGGARSAVKSTPSPLHCATLSANWGTAPQGPGAALFGAFPHLDRRAHGRSFMEGPDIREPLPPGCFCLWAPPARGLKGLLSFGRGSADGGERLKSLTRCEHQ